ncbi:MAG: hypothetical protein A2233_04155 [Candidatus Kerfeldbacteria bacterium RIFOXYA2_FULL_38_24]|uniref:Methyltransferase small domain-containing protein n=1 Tax=Candidatus Kerfeldbacteria bacterium RIFOXYB2_FULL_38_14 TaxID=1798547 RepID=A0A1G2BCF7_9BACT|nr:MAG: hypothetical protein A2233_04155 [Candidatus Kerfeldbacteria bacterium RIFOXYA2_FULL_38_24]OGY86913.1 MAG: hypothetical protein A2319_00005 [Candidatus Kerfeldbacteria bacterium RIFOXYB2_FULL_38_14]
MKKSIKNGYQFHITVFGGRNTNHNSQAIHEASSIGCAIAEEGYVLVNGGSSTGMMGAVSEAAFNAGGKVYGIALADYDPAPHKYLTDFEAYHYHYERQRRLIEFGDVYVALQGAIGTFHEILEVHILNILGEIKKPIILVGDYYEEYKHLLRYFEKHGIMHKDSTNVIFAHNGEEAMRYINSYFSGQKKQNYHSPIYYPAMPPEAIHNHIQQNTTPYEILFGGMVMTVFPQVYPSNRFRSSKIFAEAVRREAAGKRVADIGCGHGSMGLVALDAGARFVVQTDINPIAIANAKYNAKKHTFTNTQIDIYHGDTFQPIPQKYKGFFDLILFNPPFHQQKHYCSSHLLQSLVTPVVGNAIENFLKAAKDYLALNGKILFGFSNKDNQYLQKVEHLFTSYGYSWKLTMLKNGDTVADNRLYTLHFK